jgi:hypothetical protein
MKSNWRKSSYSSAQGNCVQVGSDRGRVLVRDTKNLASAVLRLSPAAWRAYLVQVKGERSLAPGLTRACKGPLACLMAAGGLLHA